MIIDVTIDYVIAKVIMDHPEDSPRTRFIVINIYDYEAGDYYTDKQLRERIEQELNPYHYWLNLDITLFFPFELDSVDGEIFSYKLDD